MDRKGSVDRKDSVDIQRDSVDIDPRGSAEEGYRKSYTSQDKPEVLVGTPVREGHVNYLLMYDMLTGIRISVRLSKINEQGLSM
jgi:hypothetical protein